MRRAQQHTITFAVFDNASGVRKTGLAFSAGELQWSKDGVNFANVTGTPAEILLSDASPSGCYRLALSALEASTGWGHLTLNKTNCRPVDVAGALGEQPTFKVVADAGNSATSFVTDLASSVTDYWKGVLVRFQTGALAGQVRKVTGYNGTTKALSFTTGFTAAPATDDVFAIVND